MSELTKAFIKAQSEFPRIVKATKGQQGNRTYLYADLPSIVEAVYPVLHKHGLGVRQVFDGDQIKTQLLHEDGTCVDSVLPCSQDGLNPQDFGKKVTYYRRYAIVAMLGLAPDDDDDAAGVGAPPRQPAPAPTPPPAADSPRDVIAEAIERLLTKDRDLVKAYDDSVKTLADARRTVLDALTKMKLDDGLDADAIYKQLRGYMNSVVDERAAADAGF